MQPTLPNTVGFLLMFDYILSAYLSSYAINFPIKHIDNQIIV